MLEMPERILKMKWYMNHPGDWHAAPSADVKLRVCRQEDGMWRVHPLSFGGAELGHSILHTHFPCRHLAKLEAIRLAGAELTRAAEAMGVEP